MSSDHNQYQESAPYDMKECGTCGYPLLPEERTSLVEINGKMTKPWVGLTDEDLQAMFLNDDGIRIARYIETRIKEKNGVLANDVLTNDVLA